MTTLTERINKLTAKIERWDNEIAERETLREQATNEIVSLLGGNTASTRSIPIRPKSKLGDRIVALFAGDQGLNRKTITAQLREDAQRVSLALYHLVHKGLMYEQDGTYYLNTAAQKAPITENDNS